MPDWRRARGPCPAVCPRCAAPPAGGRVRLGGRRVDGAARAARATARTRTSCTSRIPRGCRTGRGRTEEIEAFSLEIAEELLARRIKLLVVACNSASAAALPALRERLMQTTLGVDVLGRGPARGRAWPWRPPATAASATWRPRRPCNSGAYEKAIAAADPFVTVTARRLPRARAADRARLAVRRGDRRRGPPLHAPAARRRGGHGDPRLHALPADRADAAADARAQREDRQLAARRSRARSSTCSAAAGLGTRAQERATTGSCLGRPGRAPSTAARASCSCRSARSSTSTLERELQHDCGEL